MAAELGTTQHGEADGRLQASRIHPPNLGVRLANGTRHVRQILRVLRLPGDFRQEPTRLGQPGGKARPTAHHR
ncbi:hypothetical protein GCM10023075_73100 [Streptosporangium album]